MNIEPIEEMPGWYDLNDGWNQFPRPISAWQLLEIGKWIEEHRKQLEQEVQEER
jgi:hypothetical protein